MLYHDNIFVVSGSRDPDGASGEVSAGTRVASAALLSQNAPQSDSRLMSVV